MEPRLLLHQAVLFVHVIAFALTVSAVLREDWRWLQGRRIDAARLRRTMRTVSVGLVALWATGLALWAFAAANSPAAWGLSAKLCAKLVVVCLLTVNGWALHTWVFPSLQLDARADALTRPLPTVLGAISSASWIFAGFVGVARPLAGTWSFAGFMAMYAASVVCAVALALWSRRARRPARRRPAVIT